MCIILVNWTFVVINNPPIYRFEFDEPIYGERFEHFLEYLKVDLGDFSQNYSYEMITS